MKPASDLPGGADRIFYLRAAYWRGKCHYKMEDWNLAEHWLVQVVDGGDKSGYKDQAKRMLKKINNR
jgi:hypothetical protein